jgi:transcriptional regulator with XRE-family HTH domain
MPEIGETLRETRMRRRIDMSEVEAATKIRAKYLRALENEEWALLPGPTYVKTFLRTYADYLGLDARLLVDEYRRRYERPAMYDVAPLGGRGAQRRRRGPPPLLGPGLALLLGVIVLLGALYVLGTIGQPSNEGNAPQAGRGATPPPAKARKKKRRARHHAPAAHTRVSLRLTATSAVYVCLVDASGHTLLNTTLPGGRTTRTYRSKRFRANFGNGDVRMRMDGHAYAAASSSNPIGYEMRPCRRPRTLPDAVRAKLCG